MRALLTTLTQDHPVLEGAAECVIDVTILHPTDCPAQIGTVVEGAADFYSARLTRRERKQTLAEEILSDQQAKSYR